MSLRIRGLAPSLLAGMAGACVSLFGTEARAQLDTNPPLPNVLLLVDSSGSMEYMAQPDGAGKVRFPTCNPGQPLLTNEQNRWINLVSVLTGEVRDYSCDRVARNSTSFLAEYDLSGNAPYDKDYTLPFHRILSGSSTDTCQPLPDLAKWPAAAGSGGPYAFPNDSVKFRKRGATTQSCNFVQAKDGLLDSFESRARFALMTFDTSTEPDTGVSGASANYAGGMKGLWSYYKDWQSGTGNAAQGRPELCPTSSTLEVGARNSAAPPWEGKLVPFPHPSAAKADSQTNTQHIQDALLMMRPYGATPTAGLLADARYFLTEDATNDMVDTARKFGPKDDPFVKGGCRKGFVILLTDGQPNTDLRPDCVSNCPYPRTYETARALRDAGYDTYVVGFALSSATDPSGGPTPIKCDEITPAGSLTFDPGNKCANPSTSALKSCCELGRVAFEGGTRRPYFADNKAALRDALSGILSEIAGDSTSRTVPAFAGASSPAAGSAGFNFYSSFFVSNQSLWRGVLERQRYECKELSPGTPKVAVAQDIEATKGDSFSENINNAGARPRVIVSVEPTDKNGSRTIRALTSSDGLGTRTGTVVQAGIDTFPAGISPQTLGVVSGASSTCSSAAETVTAAACRSRILDWHLGKPVQVGDGTVYKRESVLGSIYHSTPALIGAPGEFLRDTSYGVFQGLQKKRPLVLYTATTDGQLHAFKVSRASTEDTFKVDARENNELWSFMPPAVLASLASMFPGSQPESSVLDGPPVVQDVFFDRSKEQADAANVPWNTMLVAGLGSAVKGYYGVDITNPEIVAADADKGPKFKWQIMDDESGNPLFGSPSQPTITTLYFSPSAGATPREIAVAILPGGDSSTQDATPVSQARLTVGGDTVDTDWPMRANVRRYKANDPSRSLTIVRLDTGEVVRTFRSPNPALSAALLTRTTVANFDAPVTGVPVAYPNGTGVISNRVFVGDREGTLWRADLKSTNPAEWKVDPFFDTASGYTFSQGQPITGAPILSLDPLGNLVVIVSTGDQDQLTAVPNARNVVWSLRESSVFATGAAVQGTVRSKFNWHLGRGTNEGGTLVPVGISTAWTNGERVTGPMTLFNGVVYFSTFRPAGSGSAACEEGSSALWAVDYRQASAGAQGPLGRLVFEGGTFDANTPAARLESNAIIFGVGLNRTPTCYDTESYTDPFLGFGTSTSVSNLSPGGYQLVVQTGNKGTNTKGSQTNTRTFNLPSPPPAVRIDSWAAIVELAALVLPGHPPGRFSGCSWCRRCSA